MVARNNPRDEPSSQRMERFVSALFESWRRLLGLGARSARSRAGGAARFAEDVIGEVGQTRAATPAGTTRRASATLVAAGLITLATGVVGTVLLGRSHLRSAAASAALMALWCLARIALMHLASEARTSPERDAVVRAWAIGLLPYAIALTPLLHTIAWTLSVVLAFRVLRGRGLARNFILRAIALGYGSQVLALIAAWLFRNAFVAGAAISG